MLIQQSSIERLKKWALKKQEELGYESKTNILYVISLTILTGSTFPESSSAQHIIGQETVDKVTQRVESGKKGRDASFMMDTEDLKPGGFHLFRLSIRGDYKPEFEVLFDKTSYKEGDEITMTVERKTANRRIVTHPRTGEEIDEGVVWEKLPVRIRPFKDTEIKGVSPDENGTIWLEEGESFTAKTIWEKGRSSDTFHIFIATGNINYGESREYILVREDRTSSNNKHKQKDSIDNNNEGLQMSQASIPSSISIGCFPSIGKPSGGTNAPGVFSAMDGGEASMRLKNNSLNTLEYKLIETEEMEAASFTVNGGAFLYEDTEFTNTNKPVDHAVLTVFESDNQSKLNDINALADENDFDITRKHYPISTNFNGQYSVNISTSRNYFRIGISIARIDGFNGHDVYQTYRMVDDSNMQRCNLLTDTNSTAISYFIVGQAIT